MSGRYELDWAQLWHEIACLQSSNERVPDRPGWTGWDRLPAPGFVGGNYQHGGLLFIAKNPGGGDDAGPDTNEVRYFNALLELRRSPAAFRAFCDVHGEAIRAWRLWRYPDECGVSAKDCAFINMVKWRGSPNKALYDESWPWTKRQIDSLKPGLIVVLGSTTLKAFKDRSGSINVPIRWIERSNGDTWTKIFYTLMGVSEWKSY